MVSTKLRPGQTSKRTSIVAASDCDDGSDAVYGPDGNQCADGTYPQLPPDPATSPPCWDDCVYQGCSFDCGQGGGTPTAPWAYSPPDPKASPNSYASRIYSAAMAFKGHVTPGLMNAPKFAECVAALQTILKDAGLSMIANGTLSANAFLNALPNSGYSSVSQADAQPGDIVVLTDQSSDPATHVGVCETGGCTEMISNSSTPGTFTWEDSPQSENSQAAAADDNDGQGYAPSTIYFFHHN